MLELILLITILLMLLMIGYVIGEQRQLLQALTAKLTKWSEKVTSETLSSLVTNGDNPTGTHVHELLEPGATFLPSDREAYNQEAKLMEESNQRTGLAKSKRTSTKRKG